MCIGSYIHIRHRENMDTKFVRTLRPVISRGLEIMERQSVTEENLRGGASRSRLFLCF